MKKKIILKRILHRGGWRYAIIFEFDKKLIELVRSVNGSKWSQSNNCWYTDCNEANLKEILKTFRAEAEIDISEIVGSGDVASNSHDNNAPIEEINGIDTPSDTESGIGDQFYSDVPYPVTISTIQSENEGTERFGPVKFAINEPDGRLVIKFLGRYDPEWVEELKSFGRAFYDSVNREWLLRWSRIAVDSLSDYFSTRGITVIVVKKEVSPVVKENRKSTGNEVRDRDLSKISIEAIELVRKHLEEKRYSIRTIEAYVAHLELFFKYYHTKDPARITRQDISEFVDTYIIKLGYSASYQNLIISAIKMYFSLAGMRRLNLDSIDRPRRSRALPKVFSKEEVMNIFSSTPNSKHKLILWLIYSCGLRRSEVTNIKLSDLDNERGILHIREAKGNIDRIVPIPEKVWEKIKVYMKGYKSKVYLFEGQSGGKYSVESVYSIFKQSLKRSGIKKDVGVHCLRHSYATHLHESGLDIRYIQELLGHKSTRTTEIYTHVSRRNLFAIRSPIEDMDLD